MKKEKANSNNYMFQLILCIFVIAFILGYCARGIADKPLLDAKTKVITEYFYEKPATVYEIRPIKSSVVFETMDGNLWEAEVDITDFAKGQTYTVVFNEDNEIVDIF